MVSDQIINVLNNLCAKFGMAIDWSSKNVQPYLKEFMTKAVNYKFSIAVMCLIAGIILFIVCCAGIKLGIFCQRKYNESNIYSEWDFAAFGAWLFSAIGILCSISMIFYNIVTIITCKTFPEKVIIDMVQSYLK